MLLLHQVPIHHYSSCSACIPLEIIHTSRTRNSKQYFFINSGNPTDNNIPTEPIESREDTPQQHIQARHRQVEKEAREIVEDVLLQQGLDVYKYVEGGAD